MVAQHGTDMPTGVYLYSNVGGAETQTAYTHDSDVWDELVAASTTNQLFEVPVHQFYVTGGEAKVGVQLVETNCNWVYASNFKLYYAGVDASELYNLMRQMAEAAEELADYVADNVKADNLISAALTAADDCSETDEDEINAAIALLSEAIEYANESIALVEELETTYAVYADYLVTEVESSDEDFLDLLEEISSALEDSFESNDEISAYITSLKSGWTAYCQADVLENSSEEAPGEMTAAILNPDFEGVTGSNTEFWTMTYTGSSYTGNDAVLYELYNKGTFEVTQTIYGLAEGYYRVKLQGFYRAGSNAVNGTAYAANDSTIAFLQLIANQMSATVSNVLDGASSTSTDNASTSVTVGDETLYVPNSMANAYGCFTDDPDSYITTVDVCVSDGVRTLGLQKTGYVSADWVIWNGFQLYYLGTDAPTAIDAPSATANAVGGQVAIYGVDGVQKSSLTPGINIVRYADGTVQKVMVK